MRGWLAVLMVVAAPAAAADHPAGRFTIAGERFAPEAIVDARALPALDGGATILVTFDPGGAKRLEQLTRANSGKAVEIALDGKLLMAPAVAQPVDGGTVELSGAFSLSEAEALAKRISGKDPVPEEFGD